MIFEVRNHHIDPELADAYKEWAQSQAIPYLSRRLDVLGFWIITGDAPEVRGEPDRFGPANFLWIVRWDSMAQRREVFAAVTSTPEWKGIVSRVPGGMAAYLRSEVSFMESLV